MLVGLGVDILSLARLEGVLARRGASRVAKRICNERELAAFERLASAPSPDGSGGAARAAAATAATTAEATLKSAQLRFLAARWAAKEAGYKALQPWPRGWGWKNLEMGYEGGVPVLRIVPAAPGPLAEIARSVSTSPGAPTTTTTTPAQAPSPSPHALTSLLLSISHDAGVIVAAVVAQRLNASNA